MSPPTPHSIAWLAERGAVKAVRITGSDGGRLEIEDADGTEGRVARARLLWLGRGKATGIEELATWQQQVRDRAAGLDVAECWERLRAAGRLQARDLEDIADLLWPAAAVALDVDALGVAIFSAGPHFKLRGGQVQPASEEGLEAALAEQTETERRRREDRIWRAALDARLRGDDPVAAGVAAGADDAAEVSVITSTQTEALTELAVQGREADAAERAGAVLRGLDISRSSDPSADAFDVLVRLGIFEQDENLFVRRAGLATEFTPETLAAATEAAAGPVRSGPRRADLTGLLTVAIDDPGTTEIDDAFAIDGDRLVVMIADAAGFVRPGSPLADVAMERVSTLYLPRGKVPMLPPAVGQDAASLHPAQVRPCLAFSMELGADAQPIAFHVEEALCRVDHHLDYAQADAVLGGADAGLDDATTGLVRRMGALMSSHAAGRLARGALKLQRRDVVVDFPDGGPVRVRAVPADGPGRELIGELMVAVGGATGLHCSDQNIPCIYRTQPAPTGGPAWNSGRINDVTTQMAILRSLQPSSLSVRPGLHSTLGLGAYTQVTSPLRRLGDLLMHEQLKSSQRPGGPRYSAGALKELLPHLQQRTLKIRRIEGATREYWSLRYLQDQGDRVWDAVALRPAGRRWKIELSAIGLQADLRQPPKLRPGQALRVRVAKVDPRRAALELSVVRDA